MAIEDWANELTALQDQLEASGEPDLQLSGPMCDKIKGLIEALRDAVATQSTNAAGLPDLRGCGSIPSAIRTQEQLELNVTGPGGFCPTLDKYATEYCDSLIDTLNAANQRMLAES